MLFGAILSVEIMYHSLLLVVDPVDNQQYFDDWIVAYTQFHCGKMECDSLWNVCKSELADIINKPSLKWSHRERLRRAGYVECLIVGIWNKIYIVKYVINTDSL